MATLAGPGPDVLQGLGPAWQSPLRMAEAIHRKKTHDPPHPNRSDARPARTGRYLTGVESDAGRDHCGRELSPADEAAPPRSGAA